MTTEKPRRTQRVQVNFKFIDTYGDGTRIFLTEYGEEVARITGTGLPPGVITTVEVPNE